MKHYSNTKNPVNFPAAQYEAVPLEQAEKFWAERNRVLRLRCETIVTALVGKELSTNWWTNANRAFEGQTPNEQFEQNAEQVYSYLMRHAQGEW